MAKYNYDQVAVLVEQTHRTCEVEITSGVYQALQAHGTLGYVALNLFRASQCNLDVKQTTGRRLSREAYERKIWSISLLAETLKQHADKLHLQWGWSVDEAEPRFKHILFVELPTGQVSFNTDKRSLGPKLKANLDGQKGQSGVRICEFVTQILTGEKKENAPEKSYDRINEPPLSV